ncbi:hypothetical protein KIW84_024477 [Lathyrus oleraceus]|uniref:Uncharacterized protein n=1 Tax=Pisum sativum TaxID=3888 RepID=A0A9D4YKA5_PEA|nr:hypothetical protein KIW84_024477 [Pisum sativum]
MKLRLIKKQKGHGSVKESVEDSESSEDFLDGIHFEDTDEERMHAFDEEIDEWLSIRVDKGEPRRVSIDGAGTSEKTNRVFTTIYMDRENVIEDAYMTNELDNGESEDSSDAMPIVIRFNEEETLRNDFTFKVGMEFSSLKKFNKAIVEHNGLNCMEGKPKGNSKKGGLSKKTKTNAHDHAQHTQPDMTHAQEHAQHAQPDMTPAQDHAQPTQPNLTPIQLDMAHATKVFVCFDEAIRRYYGIDPDVLVTPLNDEDILDIEPLSVDTCKTTCSFQTTC